MNYEARYKLLNLGQREAVDTIDGPVMVVAGPGTGKTELLSMRVATILKKTDTLPENILCLTFTDSGAAAMRDRLTSIIGQAAYKVAIHTFHSFGTEIINQNGEFFYNGALFSPADELSRYEILRSIFDELDYKNPLASTMNGEYTHLKDVLTVISEFKKSGLTSSELLMIMDANDAALELFEKQLAHTFSQRIGPTTLSLLVPIAHTMASSPVPKMPGEVTPLVNVLALSLAHAIDKAQDTGKTSAITAWKNRWLEKDETGASIFKDCKRQSKLRAVIAIYDAYLARMEEAEVYDFDDMIVQVVHAMETQHDLRYNLQEKYQYVMVDEFQDTNMAQARILHNLTDNEVNNGMPNIMVVGDDDQAIYSFQGADISNILTFEQTYPKTKRVKLTDNYRSSSEILEAARSVITQGTERLENYVEDLDKTLTPHHKATSRVAISHCETINDERHYIISDIKKRLKNKEAPSSIAVLARRHSEIIDLLAYFSEAGIAVDYEKRDNVLESESVVILVQLARIVLAIAEKRHDEADSLLPELLAHPAWKFQAADIWKLSLDAYSKHISWMELMATTPLFQPLQTWLVETAGRAFVLPLERMIDRLIGHEETDEFRAPFYDYFFSAEKLKTQPETYIDFLEALRTIRSKLREYQTEDTRTLPTFVNFVELHLSTDTPIMSVRRHSDGEHGAVCLMTAHKSKGLEFDTVYILGSIDFQWGEKVRSRSRMINYPENLPLAPTGATLDERLRLFFVAMTRARHNLTMTYSTHDDSGKETRVASFLLPLLEKYEEIIPASTEPADRLAAVARAWYAPIVGPVNNSMKAVLGPSLEYYKLSATHLNTFVDVSRGGPQAFLMNNLLRFPSAMSPAAAYGSAIHAVLQRAHNHFRATGEQRPQEDILHDFEEQLKEKYLTPEEFETRLQKGSDALRSFLTAKYDTFSAAQKTELSFAGQHVLLDKAHLTGSLDLVDVDEQTQTVRVTDYKTGKPVRSWTGKTEYEKIKLHKYKQQLMFYKLLVEKSRDYSKYKVNEGCIQFVEPNLAGDIVSLELEITSDDVKEFEALIKAVWQHVTALDLPDISGYEPSYKGMLTFENDLRDGKTL